MPRLETERHPSGLIIRPWLRDESLLDATRADGRPRVDLYPYPASHLVLGRGSDPELELNLDAVLADDAPVYRRRGGGCAVLLDPGNLVLSVALALPGIGGSKRAFAAISDWLASALEGCGVPGVRQRGVSDLALGDRKVGGSAIYREKGLLYYSTTLLIAADLDGMERWLAHPPREPDYRRGRTHGEFVGEIAGLDPEALAGRLDAGALAAPLG